MILTVLVAQSPALAAVNDAKKPVASPAAPSSLAPLSAKPAPASSHAPFEAGDCKICHQGADPKQPGPVAKRQPELCLECHEEFVQVLKRPKLHAPVQGDCTICHNPHNSKFRKLLVDETRVVCGTCHAKTANSIAKARVEHRAVNEGAQCASCHNPHASAVEKLLIQLPFDLCLTCHGRDNLTDAKGRKLQNLKAWLDANKVWHGPIAGKDCSACHETHGGDHFRLLKDDYPAEFYAPYDPRNYALCFSCHQEPAFSTAQTSTLTSFRNGSTNLHYLHLQQSGRGRTCRACHEVHASKQDHHIREGVPYGTSGWVLQLNYKKTATGGSCEKTCHQQKTYSNRAAK